MNPTLYYTFSFIYFHCTFAHVAVVAINDASIRNAAKPWCRNPSSFLVTTLMMTLTLFSSQVFQIHAVKLRVLQSHNYQKVRDEKWINTMMVDVHPKEDINNANRHPILSNHELDDHILKFNRSSLSSYIMDDEKHRQLQTLTAPNTPILIARYIKLTRASNNDWINIMGIDVYDDKGRFISYLSTPSIMPEGTTSPYTSPYTLTDGDRSTIAHSSTTNVGNYMQLDFGKDVLISKIVLLNRVDCCLIRIIGCALSVINNANIAVFTHSFNSVLSVYEWEFGPRPSVWFRNTKGPIRSLLGGCIDATNESPLALDCNGGPNQQWVRPTSSSTDLRLQTQNNMCMDAVVVESGRYVVLSTCSSTSNSQQWIYDGRNLRLKYNTGLCLKIKEGANSKNNENKRLVVSNCDNGGASAWVEYSMSFVSGGIGGPKYGHYLCPVGSKVINVGGHTGWVVDQLAMTCDDPSNTVIGIPGVNGTENTPCIGGYTYVNVTSGSLVGRIEMYCSSPKSWVAKGGATNWNSRDATSKQLQLYVDERVIGMELKYGQYVESIAFLYSATSSWRQTLSPMIYPTMSPTRIRPTKPTSSVRKKPSSSLATPLIIAAIVSVFCIALIGVVAWRLKVKRRNNPNPQPRQFKV